MWPKVKLALKSGGQSPWLDAGHFWGLGQLAQGAARRLAHARSEMGVFRPVQAPRGLGLGLGHGHVTARSAGLGRLK